MRCPLLTPLVRRRGQSSEGGARLTKRKSRALAVAVIALFTAAIGFLSIWTCFGWRYHSLRDHDGIAARRASSPEAASQVPNLIDWDRMKVDSTGKPIHSHVLTLVDWARARRLLPEAYLYGLAFTRKATEERRGYLMGEYSSAGWSSYFPIAFAIKTPVATILLLLGGVCAIIAGRAEWRRHVALLASLVVFIAVYAGTTISSNFNIGHRHILPLYPVIFVFAGASAAWLTSRAGRWLVGCTVVWLLLAGAWIYPHYLCYFNELIGGPSRGHLYLTDSNIDWGQGMKRLAKYAKAHPDQTIKLAYFGSADPTSYGFEVGMLPSFLGAGEWAELTAGTYVVSATQLMGVYIPRARDAFWTREMLEDYRRLHNSIAQPVPAGETDAIRRARLRATHSFELLRRARMLQQLRHREPDERIGYSLFVYRLTQGDVDALLSP
jgi:hypothetical protein